MSDKSVSCYKPVKTENYSNQEMGFLKLMKRNKNLFYAKAKLVMGVSKVVEKDDVTKEKIEIYVVVVTLEAFSQGRRHIIAWGRMGYP